MILVALFALGLLLALSAVAWVSWKLGAASERDARVTDVEAAFRRGRVTGVTDFVDGMIRRAFATEDAIESEWPVAPKGEGRPS